MGTFRSNSRYLDGALNIDNDIHCPCNTQRFFFSWKKGKKKKKVTDAFTLEPFGTKIS